MSRNFRPLESKTPCEKCVHASLKVVGSEFEKCLKCNKKFKGTTKRACKDYNDGNEIMEVSIEGQFDRLNTAIKNLKKAIYNSIPACFRGKK